VAVIDTGVDYTHPDLAANMWVNAVEFSGTPGVDDDGNGYTDDIYGADTVYPDGDPQDDHGHGTHVTGIIAAQANNGEGGVGVAYNVQLMALKAAQYSGVLAASDIAEGIYYAVEKGADVINMSFGGYARSQVEEDALAVAFGQAVLVAAAGNDDKVNFHPTICKLGRDMYPAAYNWVLGVMARAQSPDAQGDYLAVFSNYDCSPQDSHEYELMAPGVDVWSTLPNENYAAWDGTSMATPVVSGIAALVRTKWYTKAVYSSRFIMGQIATSGPTMQAYTPIGEPPVFYHVPDAHAALTTFPQPQLSYLEHWLFDTEDQSPDNDDDGIVDAGETVDLAIVIRNHWGKADPVTVTLEARAEGAVEPDPYVTMISDTVSYGAIGSFNVDDNGLIYEDDVIVGVEHPFRFSVPITTPNDHVIPFLLTMTAGNGYDPDDPNAPYVFESRFYLIVQRGTELPHIISQNMTLTQDYYWLIPDQTLIEEGVTVTVTEGTQVQFWSGDPDDPYGEDANASLQVEGTLLVDGSADEPVELFPSANWWDKVVNIYGSGAGEVVLQYARVTNPGIGKNWGYGQNVGQAKLIDHCYFNQNSESICHWDTYNQQWNCYYPAVVRSDLISKSIFHKLGRFENPQAVTDFERGLGVYDVIEGNLYDSCRLYLSEVQTASDSVFLKNYRSDLDDMAYYVSRAETVGYACTGCDQETGRTNNEFRNNAILNVWWDPDIEHWMRFYAPDGRDYSYYITDNFWNTTSTTLIDAAIEDSNDDVTKALYIYQPTLTTPATTPYPFGVDVTLSTASDPDATVAGAETVTFTVTFNRDMDTSAQPAVSFGPDAPYTDFTVEGDWTDARTWVGTFHVTPVTGDGYQLIGVADAVAADDPRLVTGDDSERLRFEIITSGTEALDPQATGREGYAGPLRA
ncbi:MAG: S8 family serine peptidase, partial [Ardenticatenia bacterium]|nr:S8 family serine peptidase [Ardenticatenia bacterium]